MKKSIFFVALVAAALTFVSCGSKKEKEYKPYFPQTGWEEYELKGKVKELHIVKSRSYVGDIENAYDRDTIVVYFTEKGQIEKSTYNYGRDFELYTYSGDTCLIEYHDIEDETDEIAVYKVIVKDQRGNWISSSFNYIDIAGDTVNEFRNEFSYNDQGFLTEVISYRYGKLLYRDVFSEHNENGLYRKQMSYKEDGELEGITIFEGEDMKHVTKTIAKDKEGNVASETSYEYDEYGSMTKVINKDPEDKILKTIEKTYKYDPQGNFVESIRATSGSDRVLVEERTIIYY